jgi:exopolysaccharide biosynthesis polyprenyl glycosylphosphotransferase
VSTLEPTTETGRLTALSARPATAVPRASTRRWLALAPIADAVVLTFAVAVERLGGRAVGADSMSAFWLVGFPAVTMALLAAGGLYRERLRLQLLDDLRTIAGATAIASMATIALPVLTGADTTGLPAQGVRLWLFATVYLTASRGGIISSVIASRRQGAPVPTLIVGAGTVGRLIARRLAEHREIGLNPIGFLDKEPRSANGDGPTLPVLGASWDLADVVDTYGVEHVVFTFSTAPHDVMLRMVDECNRRGIRVTVVPRLFERIPRDLTIDYLGGVPLLSIHPASPTSWRFHVKYALDRVVAALALLALAPVLLVLAVGVLLTTGRPILFRQRRAGRDGRVFEMLKFRSMRPGEPLTPSELSLDVAPGGVDGEDRRTAFGAFIRKTSLDELPQFWNVLRGDMSLVGPRPERPEFIEVFGSNIYRYEDRHRVKSGITGWAQINGLRGQTSLSDRVEWDNWYIENWSPWLDFKILLRTALSIVRHRPTE